MQTETNESENEVLDQLTQKARDCHQISIKKAQTFARQAKALQKNLELRKKQKELLNKK